MRTTVDINQDLLERLRKIADAEGISFKDALNRVITRGLGPVAAAPREPFRQQTFNLGPYLDPKTIKEMLQADEEERYFKTQRRSTSE
jgi:hypothetical protein